MSELNEEFRALCDGKFLSNAEPLKGILDELIEAYPPAVPLDSQDLSELFLSLYQGSLILAKAKNNRSILDRNVEYYRQYLSGLFNK